MKQQQGLSLIEVMISIIILGVGLLGLVGLQTRSIIMNQSAYYRSVAADLASDLADRIRANRTPFLASSDAETHSPFPPDFARCKQISNSEDTVVCAEQDAEHEKYLLASEISEWNRFLRSQLPGAKFKLESSEAQSTGFYRYKLSISWLDNRSKTAELEKISTYETVIE